MRHRAKRIMTAERIRVVCHPMITSRLIHHAPADRCAPGTHARRTQHGFAVARATFMPLIISVVMMHACLPACGVAAAERDSLRAVLGVDLLQTVPFLDKPDQATIFYGGLGYEFSLYEARSLTVTPVAGVFLGSTPPTGTTGSNSSPLFGLDVAFRSYGSYMLGFDGWYIGLTYMKPVRSTVETRHRFQTITILDGLNMSAGLTAALSRSTEIALGIRYSMNQKWRIRDGYTGHNVFTISIAVGLGLCGW